MANIIYDLLSKLLEAVDEMEKFREDPDEIAKQFQRWLIYVASALESANLNNELQIWKDAIKNVKYSPYKTSQLVHMASMKAILLGFIHKYSTGEISNELFDIQIVEGTPNYIYRIALQANGCYERGWYDASTVMIRRLIETLLIECFETYNINSKIQKEDGNYIQLSDLISKFLSEKSWHVSRSTRRILPKLSEIKELGDQSAHNRRFLATKRDIEKLSKEIRICIQELVYIASKKNGSKN